MTRIVAVIGSAGFVGGALLRALQNRSDVTAIGFDRRTLDLGSGEWPEFPEDIDCVVHSAGIVSGDWASLFRINSLSAIRLARHVSRFGPTRFIYLSTGAVYQPTMDPTTPSSPVEPTTDYGRSKWMAEEILRDQLADRVSVVRLYFPYGRGQRRERLLPRLRESLLDHRPIRCNDDGGPWLSLTHIDDVIGILIRDFVLAEVTPKVVNLASDAALSIKEISERMADKLGTTPLFEEAETQANWLSLAYPDWEWRDFDPPE